ncbi:unnamed protein product [Mesocestoides corti]|nr:unnamed protein product [Mesocestoides corti]
MACLRTYRPILLILWITGSISNAHQTIGLGDNTPKGAVVAGNVLGDPFSVSSGSQDGTVTYALLKTPVNTYFRVDERTGELVTRRVVDRDMLCHDSGLCCAHASQASQLSRLSATRSADNGELGTVCVLRLDVAVTAGHHRGSVPSTHQVFIEVKDENDHAPTFIVPELDSKGIHYTETLRGHTNGAGNPTPLLILNISEAAQVGTHRLPLPLATDLDAPPFNVQRYVFEQGRSQSYSSSTYPEKYFKLEVQKREPNSSPHFETDAPITGLSLLLIAPLDRESHQLFEFRVLAIDGGSPTPRTGTLSVRIRVTDVNDHEPSFERSTYEISVEEGHVSDDKPILKVVARDEDEGVNAQIHYSWFHDYERFGPDTKLLSRLLTDEEVAATLGSPVSPERLARLQALPTFWFRLDERTGEIFVHRPLDYEVKRGFVFTVLATNPDVNDDGSGGGSSAKKPPKNSSSTTKVTINVINLNDEAPQISIDYVTNSEAVKHKQVMENGSPDHFIALIRATDADAGSTGAVSSPDDPYIPQSSEFVFENAHGGGRRMNFHRTPQSTTGGHVTCELASHEENYTLTLRGQVDTATGGSEYVLNTKTPLDREREHRQFITIRCQDDGSPSKTSTATVEVEILDQNDCVPEITVHARVPTSHRAHQSAIVSPFPRSRLANIFQKSFPDWPVLQGSPYAEHPLVNAYEAGIPVVLVSVSENRPPDTVVASLRGADADAGENGRVAYRILKEDLRLPRVAPGPLSADRRPGRYPEVALDYNLPPVLIRSDTTSIDLLKMEPNGDVTTTRMIDREQSSPIRDELYLFIEVYDWGLPASLTSYVLLAIEIKDDNDNPPVFFLTQINFSALENSSAPQRIGEILVYDADAGAPMEGYHDVSDSHPSPPRVSERPQYIINLIINPGHGLLDLPFEIVPTKNGRFFLNVTRTLDREEEEMFRFNLQASDCGGSSHQCYTATATVIVSVVDVNDNAPEIIFPKPATATTHVHSLSYLEQPDTEILSVNANDKDSGGDNGKFFFELGPVPSVPWADPSKLARTALDGDLFKLDAVKGLLKTQRRMTEADLGEHCLQLVVRDLGSPPRETRQVIRLVVDRSPPQFASSIRFAANPKESASSGAYSASSAVGQIYQRQGDFNGSSRNISELVLVVIISLMVAGFVVLIVLLFHLRRHQKLFPCLPDFCAVFQRGVSSANPYSSPEYVSRSKNVKDACATGVKDLVLPGRIEVSLPPPSLPPGASGEFVITGSKCQHARGGSAGGGSGCGALVSLENESSWCLTSAVDGRDFCERPPKPYTECYHVDLPVSQAPQSSRMVSIPTGTFRPIMSPSEEISRSKPNFCNISAMGFHPATISPVHRSDLFGTSDRYGESVHLPSLYVQSRDIVDPHHYQSLVPIIQSAADAVVVRYPDVPQQRQKTNRTKLASNSTPSQGSCDFLTFSGSLGSNQVAKNSNHYKSEPELAVCDSLETNADNELVAIGNDALSEHYPRLKAKSVIVSQQGRSTLATDQGIGTSFQQPVENYAISFPKPQASYV